MNWNAPLEESERNKARPIASGTTQAAHDLIAFVTENVAPTRHDGEGWTGPRLAALFIAAAWEAATDPDSPIPPADYVDMIRAHANVIEDMLL